MNILWITNIILPEASLLLKEEPIPYGGWLVNASRYLSEHDGINLSIAFPKNGAQEEAIQGERIVYYAFSSDNDRIEYVVNTVQPDIVHIFGTEFEHSLAIVNICTKMGIKTVISIQGLVSIYAKHYMACLPMNVQLRYTIRDLIKKDNLKQQQKKFFIKGKLEIEAIQKVKHVIGRTTWDKACTMQINPDAQYHFCNETLREEFYKHQWQFEKCEKYSIFISQASYPAKGLHYMLEAMPFILRKFPSAKLYVAGPDITKSDTIIKKFKKSSYAKYIGYLLKKYNLSNKVVFTGVLQEEQMCERYLASNIFVCPSSIENSPNSLCEAMIMGLPCIASDVGGISDLLKHKDEGFVYQADAPYMLAYYVCELFENSELALKFSQNARKRALDTHNKEKNLNQLINIYNSILRY